MPATASGRRPGPSSPREPAADGVSAPPCAWPSSAAPARPAEPPGEPVWNPSLMWSVLPREKGAPCCRAATLPSPPCPDSVASGQRPAARPASVRCRPSPGRCSDSELDALADRPPTQRGRVDECFLMLAMRYIGGMVTPPSRPGFHFLNNAPPFLPSLCSFYRPFPRFCPPPPRFSPRLLACACRQTALPLDCWPRQVPAAARRSRMPVDQVDPPARLVHAGLAPSTLLATMLPLALCILLLLAFLWLTSCCRPSLSRIQ